MKYKKKNSAKDLKKYYPIFLEIGMIATLLIFIAATNINLRAEKEPLTLSAEQEVAEIKQIERTTQGKKPPPPPRPVVPLEVPNDQVIEEQEIDLDAELRFDDPLTLPDALPSQMKDKEEDFFIVVEEMPELIGGLAALQKKVRYPERARKAGIEGRVMVQFIVNEKGEVENPKVIRGIGGGCDEEALRAVKNSRFKPGRQRGKPVRVQYNLPVRFVLKS